MYLFYLNNILLPVTPNKVTISGNKKNTTMTLLNEGEINILKQWEEKYINYKSLKQFIKKNKDSCK